MIPYNDDQNVVVAINIFSGHAIRSGGLAILQNWAFTTLSKSYNVNVQPHNFGKRKRLKKDKRKIYKFLREREI